MQFRISSAGKYCRYIKFQFYYLKWLLWSHWSHCICTLPSQADGKTTLTYVCRSLLTVQKVACMTINPSWSVCLSCMYNVIRDFMQSHLSFYIFLQFHGMYVKILVLCITFENTLWKFKYDFANCFDPILYFFLSVQKKHSCSAWGTNSPWFIYTFLYMLEKVCKYVCTSRNTSYRLFE